MTWTATISKHNDDGLTMDIVYEREGYQPITVSALLPAEGADLSEHAAQFAPTGTWDWIDQTRMVRVAPAVGTVIMPPSAQPQQSEPVATVQLEAI